MFEVSPNLEPRTYLRYDAVLRATGFAGREHAYGDDIRGLTGRTAWLHEHLNDPALRILDARGYVHHIDDGKGNMVVEYAGARDEYAAAHIPGAVYVDWTADITDPDDPVPVQIAPPERFAAWASRAGIGDETHVVVYDHTGGTIATRVWWDLMYYGHDRVSVLDGGWKKWAADGLPTTSEASAVPAATFTPRPRAALRKTVDEVAQISANRAALLVDARAPDQYAGEVVRSGRAGHIPGAVNLYSGTLMDPTTGTWKSDDELAAPPQGCRRLGRSADRRLLRRRRERDERPLRHAPHRPPQLGKLRRLLERMGPAHRSPDREQRHRKELNARTQRAQRTRGKRKTTNSISSLLFLCALCVLCVLCVPYSHEARVTCERLGRRGYRGSGPRSSPR